MLIGRAEKSGSGVDKIMAGWDELHWSKPYLKLEEHPNRVKLILPMFHILPEQVMANLQQQFPAIGELTTDELTALIFCSVEGCISNNRLQYILKLHPADITFLLKGLVERGYLESDNKRRWANYHIKGEKVDTSKTEKVDTSSQKVDTSKAEKVDTSSQKVDTSNLTKRISKGGLEFLIMDICNEKYVKMEVIAEQVGRSLDYLKNKIFPNMVKQGKLEKKYPLNPNHPEQAYKTTEIYTKKNH